MATPHLEALERLEAGLIDRPGRRCFDCHRHYGLRDLPLPLPNERHRGCHFSAFYRLCRLCRDERALSEIAQELLLKPPGPDWRIKVHYLTPACH